MRGWAALVALTLAVAVVGTAAREPGPANVEARVNGKRVILPPRSNVGQALLEARTLPRDGVLRSVVTGSTIDPRWDAGRVLLDDRRTRLDEGLHTGDRIQVTNGVDAVETTVERDVAVREGLLPDIERDVWIPGVDGMAREKVGERSGEVVEQVVLRPSVAGSPVPGPVLALTFDDGPDPTFTPQVLQILAAAGVKATFCVVGREARRHPDLVRAIVEQGHALCDHTQNHRFLDRIERAQVDTEIAQPKELLQQIIGQPIAFFRAPGGYTNASVIDAVHKQNLRVLGWAVDPQDWRKPPPEVIVERVVGAARPGAIVLMHDGGGDRTNTVVALPFILEHLAAQGYSFVVPPTAPPAVG